MPAVWVLAALLCLVNVVHTFGFLGSIGRDRSRLALSTPVTAGYESTPEGGKPRRNATTKDLLATIPGFKGLTLEALIRYGIRSSLPLFLALSLPSSSPPHFLPLASRAHVRNP